MQPALARCQKVKIVCQDIQVPSQLNSGSQVMLLCKKYFEKKTLLVISAPQWEKAEVHQPHFHK